MTDRELAHPHDLLVRHFLSEPDLMADLLTHYGDPGVVKLLDLSTLRCESPIHIDDKLVESIADLLFWASFKGTDRPAAVFIFFEHQSTPDRMFTFRQLEYIVRAWRKHLNKTGQSGLLPYPIVIVLYHGKRPWPRPLPLSDLMERVPGIDTNILNFPIHLIDLATIPIDQLKGHPAIQALFQALQAASEEKLEERFDQVMDLLLAAKADPRILDWLSAAIRYILSLCRPENAEEKIFNTYTHLVDEEEAKKMTTSFVAELEARGEARGKTEGKTEGLIEGVLAFLEARFGKVPLPVKRAVITCTDLGKLDALARLAATCDSMEEFRQGLPQM